MNRKVTILGAGLVGSLLAILLRKKGYEVTIIERRADMRKQQMSAGRSINLAMSTRGWKALQYAGVKDAIIDIAIPMYGRGLHQQDGTEDFQQYGKNNEAIYSISRGELNRRLMNLAEEHGAQILFDTKCAYVDLRNSMLTLKGTNGEQKESFDLLFGADGAFSALRKSMIRLDRTNYEQYYVPSGYKELYIPAKENGSWSLNKNALHIWPRGQFMLIALANTDGSFTCTLFLPFEGKLSFDSLKTDEDILSFFKEYFPDALALMPNLLDVYRENPTSSLVTVKVSPWVYEDKCALIGDSAHAIVPFYGQGMNSGFEDCSTLFELLEAHEDNWSTILPEYQKKRKINGDAIADLALQNFIEMRDKVADDSFLVRKKIEKELGRMYPNIFNSVYEMVSFSHTPYSFALNCSKAQDQLLKRIMQEGDFFELAKNERFQKKLTQWMDTYKKEIEALDRE